MKPFKFSESNLAQNIEEFIQLCQKFPTESIHYLMNGDFEKWLTYIGQYNLAKLTEEARNSNLSYQDWLQEFSKQYQNLLEQSKIKEKHLMELDRLKLWLNFWKFFLTLLFSTILGSILSFNIKDREIQLEEQKQLERYFVYTMSGDVYDRIKLAQYFQSVVRGYWSKHRWNNYGEQQEKLLSEYDQTVWKLEIIESELREDFPSQEEKIEKLKEKYDLENKKTKLNKLITPVESVINLPTSSTLFKDSPQWLQIHIPIILETCQEYQVTNLAQVAYILATAQHETNYGKFMEEKSGKIYEGRRELGNVNLGDGEKFKGRGYVSITGRRNYNMWSNRLQIQNLDLVKNPEKALEKEIAAKILILAMKEGMLTGKKLDDFINEEKQDFYNARKIVNGLDRAELISTIAQNYYQYLQDGSIKYLNLENK